jgi:hypothetical protein
MSSEDDDLVQGVFQQSEPIHIAPKRREFQPWHRERKQFIRDRQWNFEAEKLIKRYLKLTTDLEDAPPDAPEEILVPHPLKCLVLPGEDLLDVRSLWKRLQPLGCWIKYIGFNCSHGSGEGHEGSRIYVATNEVNSLPNVVSSSHVLHDRLQSVANIESVAYRRMREMGPYHIINLDLCDSIFPVLNVPTSEYYGAVNRIAEYQCGHCTHPWLFFVTTQIEPAQRDNDGLDKLAAAVRENCTNSVEFSSALEKLLAKQIFNPGEAGLAIKELSDEEIFRFFGVAFGKWLLALVAKCTPPWSVRLLASYRYSIKDEVAPMFSFAFLFQRSPAVPLVDKYGLAPAVSAPPPVFNEMKYGVGLVAGIERIRDVEEMLEKDPELRKSMLESSASLLESAGYDRDAYFKFVHATAAS